MKSQWEKQHLLELTSEPEVFEQPSSAVMVEFLAVMWYQSKNHNPQQDFYEQSSDDIWSAVCNAVQQVATLAEKVILFSQW